jgi:hypothetical protein
LAAWQASLAVSQASVAAWQASLAVSQASVAAESAGGRRWPCQVERARGETPRFVRKNIKNTNFL